MCALLSITTRLPAVIFTDEYMSTVYGLNPVLIIMLRIL